MITKPLLAILAAVTLWAGAASFGVWHLRGALAAKSAQIEQMSEALRAAESARKKADKALVLQRQKNAATAREAASLRQSLAAALAAEPAWSQEPVPEEVQDALKRAFTP